MPKHIELLGIPCSGKTTITRTLKSNNEKVYSSSDAYKISVCRAMHTSRFCYLSTLLPETVIDYILEYSQVSSEISTKFGQCQTEMITSISEYTDDNNRIATVKKWVNDLIKYRNMTDRHIYDSGKVIWDEGFLQRSASIFCPPDPSKDFSTDDIREFVSKLPDIDIVIVLDVPVDISISRIMEDPDNIPKSYKNKPVEIIEKRFEEIQNYIENITHRISCDNVVRVDGTLPVDQVRHEILHKHNI